MQRCFLSAVIVLILLGTVPGSCKMNGQENVDRNSEKENVSLAIHNSIGWAKEKDFELLYGIIANDSDYIEVDPDPRVIRGFSQFRKNEAFWGDTAFKAVSYDIRDLEIRLSERGDVAWFYCMLDDINEWQGRPACWINTRWTGVLEKRAGKWIMVMQHFSFASGS